MVIKSTFSFVKHIFRERPRNGEGVDIKKRLYNRISNKMIEENIGVYGEHNQEHTIDFSIEVIITDRFKLKEACNEALKEHGCPGFMASDLYFSILKNLNKQKDED